MKKTYASLSEEIKRILSKKKPKPIEIFVRHCVFSSISHDKERLRGFSKKRCFDNFLNFLDKQTANVTFFLDKSRKKNAEEHFLFSHQSDPVIVIDEGTEANSFMRMLDYVIEKKFSHDTIIYFLEDDYLHRKDWQKVLLEGFNLPVDYVTLYDHQDKYFFDEYKNLRSKIYHTHTCHWRSTPSTTNTYAMRFKTLKEDIDIHRKYSLDKKISQDHQKFIELGNKGRVLISPIPGWSTHCEPKYASPCIDWESFFT